MLKLLKKIVGTAHERRMKTIRPNIEAIAALEPRIQRMSDPQLQGQTARFKEMLDNGATLDDLLPEAFATVRETSIRTLGIRPFDVQFIGGVTLHEGAIAEMKTGEGKTLVAVGPAYLNALEGKGVHVVTVNDYLAKRDAEWMGNIYNFLGMAVGSTLHGQQRREKQAAYRADITYGQNNEFGFDYLRDNMKFSIYDYVQRPLNFAIVDEVDSILIDEARTPLIISGEPEASSALYMQVNSIIPRLRKETDFIVDEKGYSVTMTEEGVDRVEKALAVGNLFDPENIDFLHHVNQALKAHNLYKRDVNYMVTDDGKIVIIDEFTGRTMPGRRWSDGLHQAVEAKQNVPILEENRTLPTISFQNLFRREAFVVAQAGRKSAVTVATNMAGRGTDIILGGNAEMMARGRIDPAEDPNGYRKLAAEYKRQCELERSEVLTAGGLHILGTERHESRRIDNQLRGRAGRQGDPGTSRFFLSLEDDLLRIFGAERLGSIMTRLGMEDGVPIEHKMVTRSIENAQKKVEHRNFDTRKHLLEYDDVMNQQRKTIYALRKQILEGQYRTEEGLADVRSSESEAEAERRMVAVEVPAEQVEIFASLLARTIDRVILVHSELGPPPNPGPDGVLPEPTLDNVARTHPELIEAQVYAFWGCKPDLGKLSGPMEIRDRLLEVVPRSLASQRERLRDDLDLVVGELVDEYCRGNNEESWDLGELRNAVQGLLAFTPEGLDDVPNLEAIAPAVYAQVESLIARKEEEMGKDVLITAFRHFYLREIDRAWLDHLAAMDNLRSGIGLRGYGNKDPKQEYKREGYDMFTEMMANIKRNVLEKTFHVRIENKEDAQRISLPRRTTRTVEGRGDMEGGPAERRKQSTVKRDMPKVGRNDPCPCGSGKKYKKCHGVNS